MSFVSDTLTDVNATALESHVGEIGATWAKHSTTSTGEMAIDNDGTNSGAKPASSPTAMYYTSGTPATPEYDVSSTGLKRVGTVANGFFYLAGRMDPSESTAYVAGFSFATSTWVLQKRIAGAATTLHEVAGTWADASALDFVFEIRDAVKRLLVGGVEKVTTTDNAITAAGKAGIRCGRTSSDGSYALLDNFTATDPVSGGATASISLNTSAATLSSSASVSPLAGFSLTTAAAVISGSASVAGSSSASFSIATMAASLASSAYVSPLASISLTTAAATLSGSASGDSSTGTLTIVDLKDLTTGALRANETGIVIIVNNVSTGAFVAKLTGQTSNSSGDIVISDVAFLIGTTYRVTIILSDGSEGTWKYTAT